MEKLNFDILSNFLLKNTEGVYINANDFFSYACADIVFIDIKDLEWVIPFCNENKKEGINAVMSFIAKKMPIKPNQNELFFSTLEKLKELNPTVHSNY